MAATSILNISLFSTFDFNDLVCHVISLSKDLRGWGVPSLGYFLIQVQGHWQNKGQIDKKRYRLETL